jgi:hypothetical protein
MLLFQCLDFNIIYSTRLGNCIVYDLSKMSDVTYISHFVTSKMKVLRPEIAELGESSKNQ